MVVSMIYAVNKRTKEHRRYSKATFLPSQYEHEWEVIIEADADGWIPHTGNECPLPLDQPCECKTKSGDSMKFSAAGSVIGWKKAVAYYRPILDADSKPEAPEYVTVEGFDCDIFDWWTEGKHYRVVSQDGVKGVVADDGDFYPLDGEKLAHGGYFRPVPIIEGYAKTEAPEWDGEGLPPVGCKCEVDIGGWVECEVIAHFRQRRGMVAAFITPYPGGDGSVRLDSLVAECFRPIRTPAQQAEDEAVNDMVRVMSSVFSPLFGGHDLARALYRAGYRKREGDHE